MMNVVQGDVKMKKRTDHEILEQAKKRGHDESLAAGRCYSAGYMDEYRLRCRGVVRFAAVAQAAAARIALKELAQDESVW